LNWKYKGEEALRLSGLDYTIIRATGLVSPTKPDENTLATAQSSILHSKRRLEVSQGDNISGRITRDELAELVTATLDSPFASGKTFEVRRDETESGRVIDKKNILSNFILSSLGKISTSTEPNNWESGRLGQDFNKLFRSLVKDSDRILSNSWSAI
jgi:hypothetical protein